MNSETWGRLSEWHNAWLDASPGDRERLQRTFVAEHPGLEADVRDLVAAGPIAPGFLETPAFTIALRDLGEDEAPLDSGTLVGPYRIVELIARGGMSQVYRATDVRLSRDVAVKVLLGSGRHDRDFVDRFIQEARVTAALDEPNIVRLFDVGVHDQRPFLVMELLDGETLRERLELGPLDPEDARRVALDVARGLTAAHAAGLIHRDLKPDNLFLTRAGPTKILDFGVAKLVQVPPLPRSPATGAGVLLGTAGYLAPEQILGQAVDARADLFAFGAILYELLTGRRAFGREHPIDTLYAVLHDPVPPLTRPTGLAVIANRLLEKAPAARFQSAADLAWALDRPDVRTDGRTLVTPGPAPSDRRRHQWRVAMAAVTALAVTLAAVWLRPWRSTAAEGVPASALARFTWQLPDGMVLLSAPLVSPNERQIAFVGATAAGRQLFVRDLASLEATALPGTSGAAQPFWSPDGRALGFFAHGKLLRVTIEGGAPVALADAPDPMGGAWSAGGTIVFQPALRDSGLMRVSADGGPVDGVTVVNAAADDIAHRWPAFLPDGVHFLYHLKSMNDARRGVYLGSLADPAGSPGVMLFAGESEARYVGRPGSAIGTLLTVRSSRVEARPFNARTWTLAGDATVLAVPAAASTPHYPALLDASPEVLVAGATPIPFGTRLVAMSTTGDPTQVPIAAELGGWPRFARDGVRVVRSSVDPIRGNPDLWVIDLNRGTQLRLTSGRDMDVSPVWSPQGDRIAYRTGPATSPHLAIINADGTGTATTVPCPRTPCEPTDWSADGRQLLVNANGDVWTVPVDPHHPAQPLLTSPFIEQDARYSPDGRWIAYVSDESGRLDVSIRSVAGSPHRSVVSGTGGDQPVWRADGSALFYVDHALRLQRVTVRTGRDGVTLGRPEPMPVPPFDQGHWGTTYDVSSDGTRILLPQPAEGRPPQEMTIILGWRALLQ